MKKIPTRREFIGTALAAAGYTLGAGAVAGIAAETAAPAKGVLDRTLLDEADRAIAGRIQTGEVAAAALFVRRGAFEFARAYGQARSETPFLVASITKPMTAAAVMLLRDRGQLQLSDPVRKFLPRFAGEDRDLVTIKHLLTHTSGLPDMLPDNNALRQRHAPLGEFVAGTYRVPLLFRPGTRVSYQSMGVLLLGTIVETIDGRSLPEFLARNFFAPLKMTETSLGLGGRPRSEMAQCQVAEPSDWDWNSAYWRNLASPWGGAHASARDVAVFLRHFADPGEIPLRAETRREMCTVQTAGLNDAWGLGWSRAPLKFAATCSAATFGHSGSTGVIAWHDPAVDLTCVLLTTKPAAESQKILLAPVSDLVARSAKT